MRAAGQNAALNSMEGRLVAVQCEASIEGPEPLTAAACGAPAPSGAFGLVMANILQVQQADTPGTKPSLPLSGRASCKSCMFNVLSLQPSLSLWEVAH